MAKVAKRKLDISKYMHELKADNKKEGKERGAGGKPRSQEQMVAIAFAKAKKASKRK